MVENAAVASIFFFSFVVFAVVNQINPEQKKNYNRDQKDFRRVINIILIFNLKHCYHNIIIFNRTRCVR